MLYDPSLDEPKTGYLTAHAWRFMQLTEQQRLDWYEMFKAKMQVIDGMPHDTLDEQIKRMVAGYLVWEEMERWTMETLTRNLQADLKSEAEATPPDQDQEEP